MHVCDVPPLHVMWCVHRQLDRFFLGLLACDCTQTECHSEHPFCEVSRPCLSQPHDPTQVAVTHALRFLGFVPDSVCGCVKSSCCALGATDLREVGG